jgi:hypothetical protein
MIKAMKRILAAATLPYVNLTWTSAVKPGF